MPKTSFPYSEHILQWVWNEQLFDTTALKTECGKIIQIVKPGSLNSSDGPDFKYSKVLIDGIEWNGSIELHLKSSAWNYHNHHNDENYDNVVLHVVAENDPVNVFTSSGYKPFTLNLLPHLNADFELFLSNLENSSHLPCAHNLNFISLEAFENQIEKAHLEYLDKKVNDILSFYSSEISQSKAWKHALIIAVFDGFGISHNRTPMRELANHLLKLDYSSVQDLQKKATELAFGSSLGLSWNNKGTRPNSRPAKRIETAIRIMDFILYTPFEHFLSPNALELWPSWCKKLGIDKAGHPQILYATVYLPALYFLGNLYHSKTMLDSVIKKWKSYKAPIPNSLLSKFQHLDVPPSFYRNRLGAVHQLKHYCSSKKCSECLVLKKAISS